MSSAQAAAQPKPCGRCNDPEIPETTCGAVVETVRIAVPEPFATEPGLNEQVGEGDTAGTMLVQDKLTVLLKPFIGLMEIVEVDDPPAEVVAGERGVAIKVKSDGANAVTVRLT